MQKKLWNVVFIGYVEVDGKYGTVTANGHVIEVDRVSAIKSFLEEVRRMDMTTDYTTMIATEVHIPDLLQKLRLHGLIK
jgi:hypothetical protein